MNENKDIKTALPKLRFPEFVNDKEWEENKVGSMCKSYSGGTPITSSKAYYGGDIPFIRSAEINKKNTELFITNEGLMNSSAKMVNKGDLLIALYGANSGDVAISKIDGAINQAILCLKSDNNTFLHHYVAYKKDTIVKTYIQGGQGNLSGEIIKSIDLYFPLPKEQTKIAECLSSLDDVISGVSDKIVALKEYKKGLMQQLFPAEGKTTPAYRFPEFQNDGVWLETTLIKLAKFRRGSFPQPYGLPEWYDDNGMPFIQVYDVDNNLRLKPQTKSKISSIAAKQSVFIPKETVIVTIQGSIGRVAVTQYDAYIDRTLLLFEEFYKPINKTFIAYVLQLLFEIEKEKAPGGIIKTITKEVLSSFIILLPKIDEQNRIANCIESIDNLIEAENNHLDQLKAHKKGLMQQLFPNLN